MSRQTLQEYALAIVLLPTQFQQCHTLFRGPVAQRACVFLAFFLTSLQTAEECTCMQQVIIQESLTGAGQHWTQSVQLRPNTICYQGIVHMAYTPHMNRAVVPCVFSARELAVTKKVLMSTNILLSRAQAMNNAILH